MTQATVNATDLRTKVARRDAAREAVGRRQAAARARRAVATSLETSTLIGSSSAACQFLKLFSNETRLQILALLAEGEKAVHEMESLLGIRQPALSQQLAYLRAERIVTTRREGKSIYYTLTSGQARSVLDVVYRMFCQDGCRETNCAMQRVRHDADA
ncbi:ArsR/SmtB family transcription factor [Rhodobium gokarnense]|uniref:DNA-binding transcriptional ArsR family regulator n=1 Tax=Rhodobium gokarnense TaxID=364296 RepID=A0ABT3HA81_9HYPH|nr:metalloregulator ArsR/SmtB family transcription factor [Rhodobium gokarnense]MCW2307295.1 DNA-binding transcriptional ArsR family regulator [Rhodobium gokarnense]